MASKARQLSRYIIKYYEGPKIATLELDAYTVAYTDNMYCLIDLSGNIVFETHQENFISLIKKEVLDEQRKASRKIVRIS